MGDMTLTMPITSPALIEYKGDYFVKTGSSATQLSQSVRAKLAGKSTEYLIPSHATPLGGTASLSIGTSIVYGNGVYVKSSYYGALMRSTDGVNWTPVEVQTHNQSMGFGVNTTGNVIFANGVFATAMSHANQQIAIFTSTDGATWTQTNLSHYMLNGNSEPNGSLASVINMSHDGTAFFAGVRVYSNASAVYYDVLFRSVDAQVWSVVLSNYSYTAQNHGGLQVLKTGASTWVAFTGTFGAGNPNNNPYYYTSTNGTTWAIANAGGNWACAPSSLKVLNGLVISAIGLASSAQAIYTSSNGGSTFTARATPAAVQVYDVAYGAGLYVVVGASGVILTSPDGTAWTSRTSGVATNFSVVEYDSIAGRFIAIHQSGIRVSTDGITWAAATLPYTVGRAYTGSWSSKVLQYLNGAWWAVMDNEVLLKSTDGGLNWTIAVGFGTPVNNGLCHTNTSRAPQGLMSANGMVFAFSSNVPGFMVGNTATNSWSYKNPSGANTTYYAAAYGAGLYVVVGAGGAIYTSADLNTWTQRTSGTATLLTYVVSSGNEFIAGGASYAARSTDGITWSNTGVSGALCTYSAGKFYILQNSSTLLISSTGASGTWSSNAFVTQSFMRPFKYGVMLFGGNSNSAWISQGGAPINVLPAGNTYNDMVFTNETLYALVGNQAYTLSYPFVSGANNFAYSQTNMPYATQGMEHQGYSGGFNGLFKINNDAVTMGGQNTLTLFMHNYTKWVYLGIPTATYSNAITYTVVDSTYHLWGASSANFSWCPKMSVSSLAYAVFPANQNTSGVLPSPNYGQLINYRKVT